MAHFIQVLFGHGYHPGHEYEIFLLLGGILVAFLARFKIFHYIKALWARKNDAGVQKDTDIVK